MPRIMITVKLTDAERALLRKRADKHGIPEADYLRMAMVIEATTAGDFDAWKILAEGLRTKAAEQVARVVMSKKPVAA